MSDPLLPTPRARAGGDNPSGYRRHSPPLEAVGFHFPGIIEPVDTGYTPRRLDKRLREVARGFDYSWKLLEPLIAEAKAREIHKDLGFRSWPDYIADVARRQMPNVTRNVEQRRQVVELLADNGMSQRAIAAAMGIHRRTVDRDLTDMAQNAPPAGGVTIGLDGKSYPRPITPPAREQVTERQVTEEPEPEPEPIRHCPTCTCL